MKAQTIKFRACRKFLKGIEGEFSKALLEAANKFEFKTRMTWLSEGSMMYHLTFGTPENQSYSCYNCEKEKELFRAIMAATS